MDDNNVQEPVIEGELTETTVPKFDVEMLSNNASFHYKDLPK